MNETWEERKAYFDRVNEQITKILGTEDEDNVKEYNEYKKARKELWDLVKKYGEEVLTGSVLLVKGGDVSGYTPKGKRVIWYGNQGVTSRSRYCGTLLIDGELIFTSGKLGKCFEYIFKN